MCILDKLINKMLIASWSNIKSFSELGLSQKFIQVIYVREKPLWTKLRIYDSPKLSLLDRFKDFNFLRYITQCWETFQKD